MANGSLRRKKECHYGLDKRRPFGVCSNLVCVLYPPQKRDVRSLFEGWLLN